MRCVFQLSPPQSSIFRQTMFRPGGLQVALGTIPLDAAGRAWVASLRITLKRFVSRKGKVAVWAGRDLSRQVVGHTGMITRLASTSRRLSPSVQLRELYTRARFSSPTPILNAFCGKLRHRKGVGKSRGRSCGSKPGIQSRVVQSQ